VANVAGATILGSGQIVPVLNIADLMETSSKATWADERLFKALQKDLDRANKISRAPIFLVDGQNTSTIILKGLLESDGYSVRSFANNESAVEAFEGQAPMLVLKSIELPETQENGLVYWMRQNQHLRNLPIIFFGSHNHTEGEKLSASYGGNGYFSRQNINRRMIIELIEGLT
jgi:two-component system chemotaxis sensor kinase CheA